MLIKARAFAKFWAEKLKKYSGTEITTRTGSEFTVAGIAWQYRWGEGF